MHRYLLKRFLQLRNKEKEKHGPNNENPTRIRRNG